MKMATVTVEAKVSYRRWNVPNFAVRDRPPRPRSEGFRLDEGTPITELEPATLDALAQAWLDDLYQKVGRTAPVIAS